MTRIGIPRALLWYQYYPMWRTFFEELGVEVVITGPTKRSMVQSGSSHLVSETCLPVKVFCGHVAELAEQGVDYMFIPSIRSTEPKVYNCSKFIGLPDMMKAVVANVPEIIDSEVDVNQGKRSFFNMIYEVGRKFHWNPLKVKAAGAKALAAYENYRRLMQQGVFPEAAWCAVLGEPVPADVPTSGRSHIQMTDGEDPVKIAVIGHPYDVYDTFINHNVLLRLQRMGIEVATAEMLANDQLARGIEMVVGKPYWTYEGEVVGAGGYYLTDPSVHGIICVVAFGCGPDSVMTEQLQRFAKEVGTKPYMMLTVDEHTGEAGLVTRLEAFVDMLRRRMRKASTYEVKI